MKRFAVIVAVVGVCIFGVPAVVTAQDSITVGEVVYDNQLLNAELRRLKTQYRGELEEYRRLQDQYQVAKQQYQQLGTLASLEAGVNATQVAMEARARVLKTYLQILKVSLLQQTGVEIDQKEATITTLDQAIAHVTTHHEVFGVQLDKVALADTSSAFETLADEVQQVSYKTLSLLMLGKVQTVYDKSAILVLDMKAELATQGGTLRQTQLQRGFEETQRRIESIKPTLKEAHQSVRRPGSSRYRSVYEQLSKDLRSAYQDLSQVLSYLMELLEL